MISKKDFKKEAEKQGLEISETEVSKDLKHFYLDAPEGYVFESNGCSFIEVIWQPAPTKSSKKDRELFNIQKEKDLNDALKEVKMGISPE